MKPCSRNTFLVTGTLLAMFLLHPAGQEASAAAQGTNPDKICKYKKKKCSSCSSGDCSSDSSAEDDTVKIKVAHNEECKTDPTEAGLSDEYEFAGEEPAPSSRRRRSADEPPVKMAGGFSANYVHPKNLKLYGTGGEIVRDADTNVRQIKGDTGFMDVIFTPDTKTLELRLYKPESVELKKLNGVYPIKVGEKALTIIRYVQEADDRVRTEKVDNAAEFPSVKSERVTQELGTEPYTLIQTKTYLKGEGSSAIEYKRVSKKMTVVLNGAPKEEKYQYSQEEMGSDGQWYLTERKAGRRAIYNEEDGFVTLYECNAVNEDGTPMAPIATETTYTYYNDPLQVASHGKIKTLRRNDGYWENKYYDNNASAGLETEKTESPWLDTAAHEPGAAPSGAIRIKTKILCSTDTGTEDVTETVNGVLIAKEWTEKTPYDHQKVKEVRHQPHSGGDKITTTVRYRKANDIPSHLTGKPVSIHNADGSMRLYSYELQGQNLIVTEEVGYGDGRSVSHGIRTISTQDKDSRKLKEEVRYALEGGQAYWLSSKTGVTFDNNGGCLKWVYNNNPEDYTEQRKDCCNITWERGRDGTETTYTYDATGRQTSSTTRGITRTKEYKGLTTVQWKQAVDSSQKYLDNQTTSNLAQQTVEEKSPALGGKTLTTQSIFDITARKITTTTPYGTTKVRVGTADGQLLSETGTTGITQTYTYVPTGQNGGGLIVTMTDGSRSHIRTSDLQKNTVEEQSAPDSLSQYTYDTAGRMSKSVLPDEETEFYSYENGVQSKGMDLNGDGILNSSHDRMSKNERVFDASWPEGIGSWKTSTANAWQGNWIPNSISWTTEDGTLTRSQTPGLAGYTLRQKPAPVQAGISHTDTMTYSDGRIQESSYTMENGQVISQTSTEKDSNGQVLMVENISFDLWGNTLSRSNARTGTTTYTYDEATGVLLSQTEPDQSTTSYQYDNFGRQTIVTLADGSEQHIDYNNEGQIVRQWGSQQYPVSYEYDAYGQKTSMITYQVPVGETAAWPESMQENKTIWRYDAANGNLLQKTYADGKGLSFTYTPGGKIKTQMNARGDVTTYSHNGAGQVVSKFVNDNGLTPTKTYLYDQLGRIASSTTEGVAGYQYIYNDQNQIIEEQITIPASNGNLERRLLRSYDVYGRSVGFQIKHGDVLEQEIVYSYTPAGQLAGIRADGKEYVYTYLQNAPKLISQVTSPVHTVTNTYELYRDILSGKMNCWKNKMDNAVISAYTYSINNLGQRVSVAARGEAFGSTTADWAWRYDVLGQVVGANDDTYAYDQIGNRQISRKADGAEVSYRVNSLNQYALIGNTVPTYDADGNLLAGLMPTFSLPNRNQLTFNYDEENRPVSISRNGDVVEERNYDHMGRRIKKGDTITLYDGYNAIAEYKSNSRVIQKTYAWGCDLSGTSQEAGGVGGLLCVTEYDGQTPLTSYPCYDGCGNITEYLIEENNGTLTAHYDYDTFGNVFRKTGNKEYSYQFSTKPYDVLTGLSYYNYRDYDPVSGRWFSRDLMEESGGLNLYSYLSNKPSQNVDFLGLSPCTQSEKDQVNGFYNDENIKSSFMGSGTMSASLPGLGSYSLYPSSVKILSKEYKCGECEGPWYDHLVFWECAYSKDVIMSVKAAVTYTKEKSAGFDVSLGKKVAIKYEEKTTTKTKDKFMDFEYEASCKK